MTERHPVVVGIDGSRAALDAALWAVDAAVGRDTPLRLLYAIEPADHDAAAAARELAIADLAVRDVFTAIQATERPVRIEVEIVQDSAVRALASASRSAALVCVGAVGLQDAIPGRIGSTAATLARSAHCPVAVVRHNTDGYVLAEVEDWSDSGAVLRHAVDEALLRRAPLRVLTPGSESARAPAARTLDGWRRRHPDLEIDLLTSDDGVVDFLAGDAGRVQLVVVGAERARGPGEFTDPHGRSVLREAGCTLLTCHRQHRL